MRFPLGEAHAIVQSNYKVNGSYAVTTDKAYPVWIVMDTGARPNCFALKALPDGWQKLTTNRDGAPLRAANRLTIATQGYVSIWVRLGNYVPRDEFLVCETLPVSMLLGGW